MNAVRSNNVSLKYQRFTSSGYKVIDFTKIEFVAKSQFLWLFRNPLDLSGRSGHIKFANALKFFCHALKILSEQNRFLNIFMVSSVTH